MSLWADPQLPVGADHVPVSSWSRGRSSKELHSITLPVSTRAGAHPAKAEGHGLLSVLVAVGQPRPAAQESQTPHSWFRFRKQWHTAGAAGSSWRPGIVLLI